MVKFKWCRRKVPWIHRNLQLWRTQSAPLLARVEKMLSMFELADVRLRVRFAFAEIFPPCWYVRWPVDIDGWIHVGDAESSYAVTQVNNHIHCVNQVTLAVLWLDFEAREQHVLQSQPVKNCPHKGNYSLLIFRDATMKRVFTQFDKDNSGSIDKEELRWVSRQCNRPAGVLHVQQPVVPFVRRIQWCRRQTCLALPAVQFWKEFYSDAQKLIIFVIAHTQRQAKL